MTPVTKTAELTLVPPSEARAATTEPQAGPADPAPKRMTKRCRRCGKTVPTLAGLVWRARRLSASVGSVAGSVFRARVETTDAALRDDLLRSAHHLQHDAHDEAQKLFSDLKRLQSHDRRCHAVQQVASPPPRAAPGPAPIEAPPDGR